MSWKLIEYNRKLLADEEGTVVKDPGGKTTVALVYPNTYAVGMSNLAVHSLYGLLNSRLNIVCERAFLPDRQNLEEHRRTKTPVLTIESQRPISEFDIVAFTVSFENDLLNIIPILELSKINHRADERRDDDPLIIAGGAAVSLNPAPLEHIVDVCITGEFEAYGEDLLRTLANISDKRRRGASDALFGGRDRPLKKWPGSKPVGVDVNQFATQTVIWTPHTEFGSMHLIEMMRGCPRGCSFCATPMLYSPFRMRSYESIIEMIDFGFAHRKKFGLIGAEIAAHPKFTDIAEYIFKRGGSFSLSSVRIDRITPEMASLLAKAGMRSISLGIEAATEKLRKSLGKTFTDDRCMKSIAMLSQAGITKIRLYFMIGLPGETEEDIEAIPRFAGDVLKNGATSVGITATPFVPKLLSKFSDQNFAGIDQINRVQKRLKQLTGKQREIQIHFDSAQQAQVEAFLAKAGPEAIDFLEKAHRTSPRKALK